MLKNQSDAKSNSFINEIAEVLLMEVLVLRMYRMLSVLSVLLFLNQTANSPLSFKYTMTSSNEFSDFHKK